MAKCLLLIKVQLLGLFGINKLLHAGTDQEKRRAALMALLFILVTGMFIWYGVMLANGFAAVGMLDALPSMMLVASAIVTLFFSFLKSNGMLFAFRDYDLIMSLPVSNAQVVISRLLATYGINVLYALIVMGPSLFIYGIERAAGGGIWAMMVLSLLLAPLLPLAVGVALGALIAAFTSRFKRKTLLATVLAAIATIGILIVSFSLQNMNMSKLAMGVAGASDTIRSFYPPADYFSQALAHADWGFYGLFALVSIVPAGLLIALLAKFYRKINSALFSRHTRGAFKLGTLKTSSCARALYARELRLLLSSTTYTLNSCIGAIMLLLGGIALLFLDAATLSLFERDEVIGTLAPILLSFFCAMTCTTASSISLEGKSRWLLYALPVDAKQIFRTKIKVNLTVILPAIFVSSTIVACKLHFDALNLLFLYVTPIVYAFFISVTGLLMNLRFPRFDWTSEQQAVKQSAAVLATIGLGAATTMIPIFLIFAQSSYAMLVLIGATALVAAATCLFYRRIQKQKLSL